MTQPPTSPKLSAHRRALYLLLIELTGSFIVTLNFRGIAEMNYWLVGITDTILALMVFTAIRLIVDAEGWWERALYVVGSVCGAQLAMYATSFW